LESKDELTPLQTLKALVKIGIPFEQAYAQCWQDVVDKEGRKKPSPNYMSDNHLQAKMNGLKGGRPKTKKIKASDLPKQAAIINRMIIRGFRVGEIADMIGTSQQSVSQAKSKYKLPIK